MADASKYTNAQDALKAAIVLLELEGDTESEAHAETLKCMIEQRGCECFDPKARYLTDLIDIIVVG